VGARSAQERFPASAIKSVSVRAAGGSLVVRKLIEFDDDTFDKLKQLGRDRMGTLQELADEAFADLLRKHGIPVDLKDALRKSAALPKKSGSKSGKSGPSRTKS
jgi:non-homologous end joining protein Ku